jgi:hypothetical protein
MKRFSLPYLLYGGLLAVGIGLVSAYGFQVNSLDYEVKLARNWYNANQADTKYLNQSIIPDWNAGQVVKVGDGRIYIDVPLRNSRSFLYKSIEGDTTSYGANGSTRLIMYKYPGQDEYKINMLRICASFDMVKRYGDNVAEKFSMNKFKDLTGLLTYSTIDGRPLKGIEVKEGVKVSSFVAMDKNSTNGAVDRCCFWRGQSYYAGGDGYEVYQGTDWYLDCGMCFDNSGGNDGCTRCGDGGSDGYTGDDYTPDEERRCSGRDTQVGPTVAGGTFELGGKTFNVGVATSNVSATLLNCDGDISVKCYLTGGLGVLSKFNSTPEGNATITGRVISKTTLNYLAIIVTFVVDGEEYSTPLLNGFNDSTFYFSI